MFEVAHAFGIWDINKLLDNIPYDMLIYWIVFLNKKKMSTTKQDLQLGLIVKAICEKDSKTSLPLEKYVIEFKTKEEQLEEEEQRMEAMFNRLASLPGAKVIND